MIKTFTCTKIRVPWSICIRPPSGRINFVCPESTKKKWPHACLRILWPALWPGLCLALDLIHQPRLPVRLPPLRTNRSPRARKNERKVWPPPQAPLTGLNTKNGRLNLTTNAAAARVCINLGGSSFLCYLCLQTFLLFTSKIAIVETRSEDSLNFITPRYFPTLSLPHHKPPTQLNVDEPLNLFTAQPQTCWNWPRVDGGAI